MRISKERKPCDIKFSELDCGDVFYYRDMAKMANALASSSSIERFLDSNSNIPTS